MERLRQPAAAHGNGFGLFSGIRRLLSDEIGSARGVGPDAADAWIEEQLGTREG
jgi:hypothetical protein